MKDQCHNQKVRNILISLNMTRPSAQKYRRVRKPNAPRSAFQSPALVGALPVARVCDDRSVRAPKGALSCERDSDQLRWRSVERAAVPTAPRGPEKEAVAGPEKAVKCRSPGTDDPRMQVNGTELQAGR